MSSEFKVFDSALAPLTKGVHLVEASAGTGKTFAIAMLVLRAVAELDIPIEKILIVTFTKAATEELRSRIRARLVQARDLLMGRRQDADEALVRWEESVHNKKVCVERLQLALYDIDRAGVFTIHSFCQRMLQEQALESGQLFDVELQADIQRITSEVVNDFWRQNLYSLDSLPCRILSDHFSFPEKLFESVSSVKSHSKIEPKQTGLKEVLFTLESCYEQLREWWLQNSNALLVRLQEAREFFKKDVKTGLESWFAGLESFFSDPLSPYPEKLEWLSHQGLLKEVHGTKLKGDKKKQAFLDTLQLPDAAVCNYLAAETHLVLEYRLALAQSLREEVSTRLLSQGIMSFDDLIVGLSKALAVEGGMELQEVLAKRYHMALIDEFQDTDSRQWHIFSTIFADNNHFLYLIGDPKQAIYRFRGADIHSYFQARNSAKNHLTLEKNYRTHPQLVEEVNRLFLSTDCPFGFKQMTYRPVAPAKTPDDCYLKRAEDLLANMVYCQLPENKEEKSGRWTSGKAGDHLLTFVLAEISRLLDRQEPVVLGAGGRERSLKPEDIAVLVRTNNQAEQYVDGLAALGIPAVVSSKQSVYQSREAQELHLILKATASPGEITTLKAAMTLSWFPYSGDELVAIWENETEFEAWHARFLYYHQLWHEAGFLVMFMRLLIDEEVFFTLASMPRAERTMANIHHLMELVGDAESGERLGIHQTLQWLENKIQEQRGEESELRLESDEQAVRIMTMHGAKGLEFPIVFCPFLWYRSSRLYQEKQLLECYDGEALTDLGSEHFERRRLIALEEELAEELRLLYVALTRAVVRCYTMWADVRPSGVRDSFSSSLGYLLYGTAVSFDQQVEILKAKGASPYVDHLLLDDEVYTVTPYRGRLSPEKDVLSHGSVSARALQNDWQMSSYSAMAALGEVSHSLLQFQADSCVDGPNIPITGLPAGTNFGNLIHDCCEERQFSQLLHESNRLFFEEKCRHYGVDVEVEKLEDLLANIVMTPLWVQGLAGEEYTPFRLLDIPDRHCLKEMEFCFHLAPITTGRINELLKDEPTVTPLSHRKMQGYLTGFVDLICEYGGRYYILDYKTNFLGEKLENYQQDKLIQAMASHNYGLQYWIYTMVVHKHLLNILPGYSYQKHFGGVMYLFVRGMTPKHAGNGVFYTRPDEGIVNELIHHLGGREDGG